MADGRSASLNSHTARERRRLSADTPTCPHIAEDQRIPMVHRDAWVVLHPDTQGFVDRAREKSPIRITGRRVPTLESSYAGNNHVTFPAPKLGIEAIATGPIARRGDGWSSGHRRRNDEVNGGKEDGDNKPGGSHTMVHKHDSFRVQWQGGYVMVAARMLTENGTVVVGSRPTWGNHSWFAEYFVEEHP